LQDSLQPAAIAQAAAPVRTKVHGKGGRAQALVVGGGSFLAPRNAVKYVFNPIYAFNPIPAALVTQGRFCFGRSIPA